MKNFRRLQVWQKAHAFTLALYKQTRAFPREELYGHTSQMRRAAVSIPSNVAEGCGRHGDAELARFCQIAMGSASEVEYQLELARDLGYVPPAAHDELNSQLIEVKKMLNAFLQKLKSNRQPPTANHQPPTTSRQPPTANHQPLTANHQSLTANR